MSETVSFPSNGDEASGYLALPPSGSGPGLLLNQEWWGLNPQVKRMADRLAGDGFVVLVPDLYHGELANHDEMDKAAHLMTTMPMDRAARDMSGAVDYLLSRDEVTGSKIGAIGFCMGGMLTLVIAALQGDKVGAAAPYYGAPLGDGAPDWSGLTASVSGHFAENDDFFGPGPIKALEAELKGMGKDVTFEVHSGTSHAFVNEDNPMGSYNKDVAEACLAESVSFLKSHLSS